MPTVASVMAELKKKGTEKGRILYARHGMPGEHVLGVSVADIKVIAKAIKGEQALACALYDTGKMEAMYLAGLVANGSLMTKAQLNSRAAGASNFQMIAEYAVPVGGGGKSPGTRPRHAVDQSETGAGRSRRLVHLCRNRGNHAGQRT